MIVDLAVRRIGNQVLAGIKIEDVMILVFQDLLKEANIELFKIKPTTPEQVAKIYEEKAVQWEQICGRFKGPNLNPWGFRLMLRKYAPNIFRSIVGKGFANIPIEVDPEYIPPSKKRHKKINSKLN